MKLQIVAAVSLLGVSLASVASAEVVRDSAPRAAVFSAPASSVTAWHETAAEQLRSPLPLVTPSPELGISATGAIRFAFPPILQFGSPTLRDSLPAVPPFADAGRAPQAGPAVDTFKLGSPSRPFSGMEYDEHPVTPTSQGPVPSIVPLPPAVFGGLAGLAALAIGRSVIRRGRSA